MTNFEMIVSKSPAELAEWLNKNCQHDEAPWALWFDKNYCEKCEPITCKVESTTVGLQPLYPEQELDFAYCELENKCKFCSEAIRIPDMKTTIKMWLTAEVDNDEN